MSAVSSHKDMCRPSADLNGAQRRYTITAAPRLDRVHRPPPASPLSHHRHRRGLARQITGFSVIEAAPI
jgi:hypothetical protein